MNIVIVSSGGNVSDPTTKAVEIIENTLKDLNVNITKIDLFNGTTEYNQITSILQNSDAFILSATVEWVGIGTNMQRFLDNCWAIKTDTMFKGKNALAVVLSKNGEEEDAVMHIKKSFQMLGGNTLEQLTGMIKDENEIMSNPTYIKIIEKKTEDFYRMINQKRSTLPTKYNYIKNNSGQSQITHQIIKNDDTISMSKIIKKEENKIVEQPSVINYDEFEKKQENDILEITKLFKEKLVSTTNDNYRKIRNSLTKSFVKEESKDLNVIYQVHIKGLEDVDVVIKINNGNLSFDQGIENQPDLTITIDEKAIEEIVTKSKSMQKAFLRGDITVKGSVILLHNFDKLFKLD